MVDTFVIPISAKLRNIILICTAALLIAVVGGFYIYSAICPCERTPGGLLMGERVEEPVTNWAFANDVPLCQVQIWAGIRPHSINLNCMSSADGKLYLSCSYCDTKYWASKVGVNEPGRLRLNGEVYPVFFNRVTDEAELDKAWGARIAKLQVHSGPGNPAPSPDAPRADGWWSFNLASAISASVI